MVLTRVATVGCFRAGACRKAAWPVGGICRQRHWIPLQRPAQFSTATSVDPFTDEQRFLFDLNGFLVLRGAISPEEIAAANAAVDANMNFAHERQGELRNTIQESPLSGDGKTGRKDLGGVLGWDAPYREPFRSFLAHPSLVPYINALCGPGYRLDHSPFVIAQHQGSEGFHLHGGPLDYATGKFNPGLQYRCVGGEFFNTMLGMSVQLVDHNPGDGGFCIIRGSHKINFKVPKNAVHGGGELAEDHFYVPATKAGDVIFFSEATVHGAMPWNSERERRIALYRFSPATIAYGRAYSEAGTAQWPASYLEGCTPAQRAVLEPPYANRLDRPVLSSESAGGNETAPTKPRAKAKVEFDRKVFGTSYF